MIPSKPKKEKYEIWVGKTFLAINGVPTENLREIKIFRLNDCKEWGFIRTEKWAKEIGKKYKIPVQKTKTYDL